MRAAYLWHRQLHIFLHPFYYVEYGIAQLGALQVWANSSKDKARALARLQTRTRAGRLETAAGIVRRRRLPFRFQRGHHQTAGGIGASGVAEAGVNQAARVHVLIFLE